MDKEERKMQAKKIAIMKLAGAIGFLGMITIIYLLYIIATK